eukprot:GHVT01053785.1.p3 GENE.GHVT01053785.1~~GHVT01053785.1.p3  ORF type:complete len:126 (+),score=17.90 GHVT01053785.1:4102-4479(+)
MPFSPPSPLVFSYVFPLFSLCLSPGPIEVFLPLTLGVRASRSTPILPFPQSSFFCASGLGAAAEHRRKANAQKLQHLPQPEHQQERQQQQQQQYTNINDISSNRTNIRRIYIFSHRRNKRHHHIK